MKSTMTTRFLTLLCGFAAALCFSACSDDDDSKSPDCSAYANMKKAQVEYMEYGKSETLDCTTLNAKIDAVKAGAQKDFPEADLNDPQMINDPRYKKAIACASDWAKEVGFTMEMKNKLENKAEECNGTTY